ncbi:Na(+)-translocating NADH-quinone reductase subunit C [soil metagenome]
MPFNRDSNSYIIIFVAVMVGIVAISLAFMNSALQPTIKENEVLDKKAQILSSVIVGKELTKDFVDSEYKSKIEEFLVDSAGNLLPADASNKPFNVDFRKEIRKPEGKRTYPVFKYTDGAESYYIFPLEGQGLWDRIWGYISVKGDFNTIHGSSFGHKGETPGLGAIIVENWFTGQFHDKKAFNNEGVYALDVLKGQGNAAVKTDPYKVDGISGATITSQGVNAMLAKGFDMYKPFFDQNTVK